MDPFWERVSWAILVASFGGVGWMAKRIIKPWSDAALARSAAFVTLVETLKTTIPGMVARVEDLEKQANESNKALHLNTASNQELCVSVNGLIEAFGSDPFKICRAMSIDDFKAELERRGLLSDEVEEAMRTVQDFKRRQKEKEVKHGIDV